MPKSPFARLVDPNLPSFNLSIDIGSGFEKYRNYLLAPFAKPEDSVLTRLTNFMEINSSGYATTHQYLSLVWAEEMGITLTSELKQDKQIKFDKIFEEQKSDFTFSDLYAERVAILILYGDIGQRDIDKWCGEIIAAQQDSGDWGGNGSVIREFDGDIQECYVYPAHTTVLSILCLELYLNKMP